MKPLKIWIALTVVIMIGLMMMPVYSVSKTVGSQTEPATIPVQDIDLGDYQLEMFVGKTQLLNVTVLPHSATNQDVIYKSENTNIATINMMGRITAVAIGESKISVTAEGITRDFTLKVTIEPIITEPSKPYVSVTNIEISGFKEIVKIDDVVDLTANVLPKDATNPDITYTSSNTSVATVSSSGHVKGIAAGTSTITLEADGFSISMTLTVKVSTKNIELNTYYIVLNKSNEFQLTTKVKPFNADQTVSYKSTSLNVASVSANGLIKALKPGSTSIMVSTWDTSKIVTVIVNEGSSAITNPNDGDSGQVFNPNESIQNELVKMIYELQNGRSLSVLGSMCPIVTSPVLKELYGTNKSLVIKYSDYTVTVLGANIKNIENELNTNITASEASKRLELTINNGKNIPGKIQIQLLSKPNYSHLYLYNDTKNGYQELNMLENRNKFYVDSGGKYILTHEKISTSSINWIIVVVIAMFGIGLGVLYIAVKKRHWFW